MKISVIGVGRLGGALALALSKNGCEIENLVARQTETAEKIAALIEPKPRILNLPIRDEIAGSEIIFICTQDTEIEAAAANLAGKLSPQTFVFHVSGSLSSSVLHVLKDSGNYVGSLHPLVSVSDALLGAQKLADVYFCVEGDAEAVETAKKIVSALGGRSFSVATEFKALYHAAAVTASGHLTALFSVAVEMLARCGLSDEAARRILLPLVESTVANLAVQTPVEALTGTFARADAETLRRHLEILRAQSAPELVEIYLRLGLRSVQLAQTRAGANLEKLSEMREMLQAENKFSRTDS